jgi:hypothetical protein
MVFNVLWEVALGLALSPNVVFQRMGFSLWAR